MIYHFQYVFSFEFVVYHLYHMVTLWIHDMLLHNLSTIKNILIENINILIYSHILRIIFTLFYFYKHYT